MNPITKEKLVKIIKTNRWLIQGFNGLPIYLHNVATNTGWMIKNITGVTYSHFFLRMHESRAKYYYDESDLIAIGNGYFKKNKNIKDLITFRQIQKTDYLKARKTSGKVPQKLNTLNLHQLVSLAKNLSFELTMSIGISHSIEGISFVSEQKLKELLNQRNANTHENFHLLSSPNKPSFLSLAQTALWNIKNSKGMLQEELIKKFLKSFGWIENSYVRGKVLSKKHVLEKAKHQKHFYSLNVLKKTKADKANLVKKLHLNKQEQFVVQTIELCTSWQDDRKKFLMQTIGRFEPVLEEIAKRLNLSTEQFKYINPKELSYEKLNNKNFLTELARRYPKSNYYSLKNQEFVFSGKEATYIENQLDKETETNITELTGMIASKGKVKGRVKICMNIHDIPKVKKGEILIASMTRPEFLPAMQKAAAFVTDEGGITSHAAIVSREMKKPCIIGTKHATKVFKDGDLVEVNSDTSIIRLLKKKA